MRKFMGYHVTYPVRGPANSGIKVCGIDRYRIFFGNGVAVGKITGIKNVNVNFLGL